PKSSRLGAGGPAPVPRLSQRAGERERACALFAASPLVWRCGRQDLNLHSLDGSQALNLPGIEVRHAEFALGLGLKPLRTSVMRPTAAHDHVAPALYLRYVCRASPA